MIEAAGSTHTTGSRSRPTTGAHSPEPLGEECRQPTTSSLRLRRIEMQGFKTFANHTVFEFTAPITAIVGPNGSGKSNLADAIRWVLGEQSLKAVRGRKTEDVIFAGGAGRAPAGYAEVSLTLENPDGTLPLPFSEVTITRRAYRTGENEYFLNRARVRLRDLSDLLLKARLAQNAYSVIGQGMVDAILNQRPEERRELLEEAADVKRYYRRIAEAQERLAETEQNLLRVQDVIAELKPRLETLERQARRAAEHRGILRELQATQQRWFAHRLHEYLSARRLAEEAEQRLAEAAQQEEAHTEALHRQAAAIQAKSAQAREAQERLRQELSRRQAEVSHWRQQSELARELARAIHRQRRDVEDEIAELRETQSVLRRSLAEHKAELEALQNQRKTLQQALAQTEAKRRAHHALHQEALASLAKRKQRLTQMETDCQERHQEVELWRGRLERVQERLAQQGKLIEEQEKKLQAWENTQREKEAEHTRAAEQEQRCRELLAGLASLVEKCESAERSSLLHLEKTERELSRMRARLEVLQHSEDTLTGYYGGVKAVLAASTRAKGRQLKGIVGPVSALLRAPAKLEVAIEVALGAHVQDLVVERWEDAEAAIAYLKETSSGRATFLPLDTIRWSPARGAAEGEGVLGIASALVDYDQRHRSVAEHLLGRTLVVANLEVARRALRQCGPGWQIVTLSGEIVRASGAVTGGSAGAQSGLLSRARELRELPPQVASLERDVEEARARLAKVRAERQRVAQEVAASQRQALEAEVARHRAADAMAGIRRELAALATEHKAAVAGRASLLAERDQLHHSLDEAQARLERALRQREALGRDQGVEESALAKLAEEEEELSRALARLHTEETLLEDRARAQSEQVAAIEQSLKSAELRWQARAARAAELAREQADKTEQAEAARQQEAIACKRMKELEEKLVPAQLEVERLLQEAQVIQQRQEAQRERLSQIEAERRQAAVALQRVLGTGETLRQEVERDLGAVADPMNAEAWSIETNAGTLILTPQVAADARGLRGEVERLRHQLRALGAVNPEAVEEFEQAKERYSFLTLQVEDLQRAADSLRQVISELEGTARELLQRSFTKVAAEFRRTFTTLFNGGSARLVLTSPNDLTQTGIEICAQPPGKRSHNLALLSGGERALTGVALLFAILSTHPIPFCFLDEVDAALDETNVGRFCAMLRQLSSRTQFILVTHNRLTMEAAGALYGVSLSEKSVSRLVSLRLDDHGAAENGGSNGRADDGHGQIPPSSARP